MNKLAIAAAALFAAALAQPALAITFSKLTTIYIGAGVTDNALGGSGATTSISCSNVSGVTAQVRWLLLTKTGTVLSNETRELVHGATLTAGTHANATQIRDVDLGGFIVLQGVVNIESTQSGVFCTAVVIDSSDIADGYTLPLVRVNPHPGTVE